MGNRNKQPFYSGGNPSFPLSPSPYFSRAEDQRVAFDGGTDFDRVKNYQSIAFRPGFSLQASELNEIQEHFQMQLTLSIAMMNNWICSGGFLGLQLKFGLSVDLVNGTTLKSKMM